MPSLSALPPAPASEEELEQLLARPTPAATATLQSAPGDVLVLGAGGKMGPSLTHMLRRAADAIRDPRRIIAVSRFGSGDVETQLRSAGIETIRCDLADRSAVEDLPSVPNVFYLAGQKFGTRDSPAETWAANTIVPAVVAERFRDSRIVAFSTGNVYPLTPIARGGSREGDPAGPVGEYALSCVGRERVFEYFSRRYGTPVSLVRLNYAIDLRYGVLVDVALRVYRGEPVNLRMGYVNVIWQGDANALAIQCLEHASSPPFVVNVTGREVVSIRSLAERFGELFGRQPVFTGSEAADALLSNTTRAGQLFPPPEVPVSWMISWVAEWIRRGGTILGKPTSFEEREGNF